VSDEHPRGFADDHGHDDGHDGFNPLLAGTAYALGGALLDRQTERLSEQASPSRCTCTWTCPPRPRRWRSTPPPSSRR
jgi:hypothetical protein